MDTAQDMPAKEAAQIARVRQVVADHGEAWSIIEEAGMERERPTGALYATYWAALDAVKANYDEDEREAMHVDVARWDTDGDFWTYDR